jgi:hypothetical protein
MRIAAFPLDAPVVGSDDFEMSLVATKLLSKSTADALSRKAKRRGMTVDAYVKELIAEDAEVERLARTKSFAELAMPFQKALAGLSESDLDAMARPGRVETSGKTKR